VYGPGKSYNIFAGKDGSKGLGKSSLNPEDAVPDYSDLPENESKVLDDWFSFFQYVLIRPTCTGAYFHFRHRKRYNVVGRVTDMPASALSLANL
jgi:hypothetical protein